MDEAHLKILRMIQDGIISAEEAQELLAVMDDGSEPVEQPVAALDGSPGPVEQLEAAIDDTSDPLEQSETMTAADLPPKDAQGTARAGPPQLWERIWIYVAAGGLLLAAIGVVLTLPITEGQRHAGWLACTVPLMAFGVLVVGVTWWSLSARWLHVKVHEEDQRINISMPLPLRLAGFVLRLARPWVPQLRNTAIDEVILSLASADIEGQEMLVVEVDDTESGEQVEIRIG